MAQTTQLSRYSPTVLAITGIAAAYGIYLVYSTWTARPAKGALRRSNAVHRPRRDRRQSIAIGALPASDSTPFGKLQFDVAERTLSINIALEPLPSKEDLQNVVGQVSDSKMREAEAVAVFSILLSCSIAQSLAQREIISRLGFEGLPDALSARNKEEVRRFSSKIAAVLGDVDQSTVDQAIEDYLNGDVYARMDPSSSEDTIAEIAATEDLEGADGAPREPSQGLKGLLYYIAEEDARRKAYEHRGIHCEECGENPIRGVRWHCLNCPDFDLCSTCEAQTSHTKTHLLVKIKIPLPLLSQPTKAHPLWYPGDPRKIHPHLDASVRKRLSLETGLEEPKIDAFYDQFTCIANVPWPSDPLKVQAAIDKRAFYRALTSERWTNRFAPNAIHDRMFAFYDTNHDDRIGFEEFISGIAYVRGPKRFSSMRRALKGFDIDGDGIVRRKDFLRLFRAKYAIQKQLVDDIVEAHQDEHTYAAMDALRSSQPISSVFNQEEIPSGEEMPRHGKQVNQYGDLEPLHGARTILEDEHALPASRGEKRHIEVHGVTNEQLRDSRHLRLMLYGPEDEASTQPAMTKSAKETSVPDIPTSPSALEDLEMESTPSEASSYSSPFEWDPLRVAVEDGFEYMLNPLFEAKETEGYQVSLTRDERQRWRKEIDKAVEEKRAFQEELRSAAMVDPLMATAMESLNTVQIKRKLDQPSEPAFRGDIVPTDAESLAEREADIARRPLEDLLRATGYSTIDMPALEAIHKDTSACETDQSTACDTMRAAGAQHDISVPSMSVAMPIDSTWPQFRPNLLPPLSADSNEDHASAPQNPSPLDGASAAQAPANEEPPSRERLEYLALLDDAEKEMKARGGPGRLTLDEIGAMVEADSTRELRGLVTSWLDLASF